MHHLGDIGDGRPSKEESKKADTKEPEVKFPARDSTCAGCIPEGPVGVKKVVRQGGHGKTAHMVLESFEIRDISGNMLNIIQSGFNDKIDPA